MMQINSTRDVLLLCATSLTCASVICSYSIRELASLSVEDSHHWRPRWMSVRCLQATVALTSFLNIGTCTLAVFCGDGVYRVVIAGLCILFVCFCTYGSLSIRFVGECGCGGSTILTKRGGRRRKTVLLITRNALLFGLLTGAVVANQSARSGWNSMPVYSLVTLACFPLILLIALFASSRCERLISALRMTITHS